MKNYRQSSNGFGVSWGVPGLRFGRSQYGTWWVSIRLPFGFRITKRLGRMRDPNSVPPVNLPSPYIENPPSSSSNTTSPYQSILSESQNQKILDRMKRRM